MHISFLPEYLVKIQGWPITNALIMAWLAIIFLVIFSNFITRRLKEVPGKVQCLIEVFIEEMVSFMTTVTGDKEKTKKFFPLVATFFLFILISNWMGILPGVGSIGIKTIHENKETIVPLMRSVNSDLNMTLALGILSIIAVQIFGITAMGFFKYASRFISFRGPISFFTGILEIIAEVAKIISFSFRLFGNVFAGEVLLTAMFFLIPLFVPLPFLFLEIFVGFIQALVFSMLTLVFLTVATSKHH